MTSSLGFTTYFTLVSESVGNDLKSIPPPPQDLPQVFVKGSVILKWIDLLSNSIRNSHPLYAACWIYRGSVNVM